MGVIYDFEKMDEYIKQYNYRLCETIDIDEAEAFLLELADKAEKEEYIALKSETEKTGNAEELYKLSELSSKIGRKRKEHMKVELLCQAMFGERYEKIALYWAAKAVNKGYLPAYDKESWILMWGASDVKSDTKMAGILVLSAADKGDPSARDKAIREFEEEIPSMNWPKILPYSLENAEYWYSRAEEDQNPENFNLLLEWHNKKGNVERAAFYARELLKMQVYKDDISPGYTLGKIIKALVDAGDYEIANTALYEVLEWEKGKSVYDVYRSIDEEYWLKLKNVPLERKILKHAINLGENNAKSSLIWDYRITILGWRRYTKKQKMWVARILLIGAGLLIISGILWGLWSIIKAIFW